MCYQCAISVLSVCYLCATRHSLQPGYWYLIIGLIVLNTVLVQVLVQQIITINN